VQLAANVGRAFRAPNLLELYSNGPRLGENRYEIGDSTLKPEVSLNVDASLRWQAARFRGEVGAYRNRIEDFIYFRPTGTLSGGATPLPVYQYDRAKATLTGMEAAVALDVSRRVTTWVRADYVRGQNDTRGEPLPLMPPARGLVGLRYHRARWYTGAESEAVAKQTRLAPNDIPTAGYVLVGFEGGYQLNLGGRRVDLDARLRNATNRRYRNYLNRYKEFALDAGIGLEVRLATSF
jgi:iron complex outermembrane receptor protein